MPPPIRAAFRALETAGVPAVILRGYLPLSDLARSPDIDVFVPRPHRARAARALAAAGWRPRRHQTGRYPHRFFDSFDVPGRVATTLDLVDDLVFGPRVLGLRHPERLLEGRESADGLPVPDPWLALLAFGLHVVLDKETRSPANAARGAALWSRCIERPAGADRLARAFGERARAWAAGAGPWLAGGAGDAAALRAGAAALPVLVPHPIRGFVDRRRVAWRVRRARPFRIAVLGMDGSGKSTVIERAAQLPSSLPIGTAYLGYNQFTTRGFRWLLARRDHWTARAGDRSVPARVYDVLRALWWPVELRARMRKAEWWRAVVLYDRYPFPAYERENAAPTLLGRVMRAYERLWTAFLPAPDALLLLDGDARVIWSRKREYAFEVYERARERLGRLYDDFRGEKRLLRTDGPLAATLDAVPEILRGSPGLKARVSGPG